MTSFGYLYINTHVSHETYVFNLHNDYTNIITNESIVPHETFGLYKHINKKIPYDCFTWNFI